MRIGFISPFLFRYSRGIERYTVELANALARQGHEIHLVSWKEKKWETWKWGDLHAKVFLHVVPVPRFFSAVWAGFAYAFLLRRLQLDAVVLAFTWHGEEIAHILGAFSKARIYLVLHYPAEQVPYRYALLQKSPLRKAAALIAVSQFVAEGAFASFGQSAQVIPNGVNLYRFEAQTKEGHKEAIKKQFNIPDGSPLLLTAAALEARKGIGKVLNALPELLKKFPGLIYVIAGEGPQKEDLLNQVKDLGLERNVRFLGAVESVQNLYAIADLFILLSTGEAASLVILEAMASGLPVIAANRPPLTEFSESGGIVYVNDEDAKEVAESIAGLLADPEKRFKMGKANRKFVEAGYSWDIVAQKYITLFSQSRWS